MADYILSCESTADLSAENFADMGVEYICFHFELDGKQYFDDLGKSVPFEEFYRAMQNGSDTKTAAIGAGEYEEYFKGFLDQGLDILHASLSGGISATVDSARIAAEALREAYPERKIYIVDSMAASSGYGLFMQGLADQRAAGLSVDECYEWAEANKLRVQHWFFSTDLTFYIKGGRVKPVSGYVGNLLGICPLLNVDYQGKLIPREKLRSKKKVYKRIVEKMAQLAENRTDYSGKVFISQSACLEDAAAVVKLIDEQFPNKDGEVLVNYIGTTIGSHTGPGTVALFFWGDERVD